MIENDNALLNKKYPDLSFEQPLWQSGLFHVAGIDEAGRGPLAGPVAAAVLILPPEIDIIQALWGVRDSKQMSAAQREHWADRIRVAAVEWGVGFAAVEEIDAIGIAAAVRLAVQRSLDALTIQPDHLLVDYIKLPQIPIPQTALVKGDARCLSIAGASVLAKTARDSVMRELDLEYQGYGFAAHKGYGTAAHLEAIKRLGGCPIHRKSFAPLKGMDAR